MLAEMMCFARLDGATPSDFDYRACALEKNGTADGVTGNPFGMCPKTVHVDVPRARKVRLDLSSRRKTYSIICLSSASTSQRSVFAWPLFEVEQLPEELLGVVA